MRILIIFFLLTFLPPTRLATAQQPSGASATSPTTPSAPPESDGPSRKSSSSSGKSKTVPEFLLTGTVFNDKALSFPGVRLRVRRSNEKKFRWETYTNSRGEFAIRVPEGAEYEVLVQAKNFQDQSRKVAASSGAIQDPLSIKLEPVTKEKTRAKP